MLAGIMAAVLSSASTFLSLVGFSVSNDIGLHKKGDEAKTLRFSRIMMLVVGALALAAGLIFPPQIFWLTTFIATVFASSWGPVGLMAIWSKKITEKAAFWGMLTGLVFNVVPKLFQFLGMLHLPSYLNPVIIGGIASLVVTIIISYRTTPSDEEVSYLEKLHERPADEVGPKRTRTTLIAPVVLIVVNGFLPSAHGLLCSALPAGNGNTDAGWVAGLGNRGNGLMVSWSVIWIALGVFAIRYILKAYDPAGVRPSACYIQTNHEIAL